MKKQIRYIFKDIKWIKAHPRKMKNKKVYAVRMVEENRGLIKGDTVFHGFLFSDEYGKKSFHLLKEPIKLS